MNPRTDAIVEWLRRRLAQSGARGFVVGLSGGVDSSVVARLCQVAAPAHVVGVLMPCHSDPGDERDARMVAEHFGIDTVRIDLGSTYDHLIEALRQAALALPAGHFPDAVHGTEDIRARVPPANVKPRLRMAALYFLANTLNYLVAGTGNRSELAIGYFTKYGDGGVDLLPIGDLLKGEVFAVARELGVPERIVDRPPSAGLWLGQMDEMEMGFTYAELGRYLMRGAETISPALAMRIERLIRASEHKRALPPIPGTEA